MNTNMKGLDVFQKSFHPWALDKSSLSFERVNNTGELGYDGPLYDGFLHFAYDGRYAWSQSDAYISSIRHNVYDGFCIYMTDQFSWSH